VTKTIAFTICSINYLAQAKTLGESLAIQNPEIEYVIGLVDRLDKVEIDADKIPQNTLLEIDKIGIEGFEEMCENYNITELNTAVKPFYFDYFYKHRPDIQNIIYFDPDIIVFEPLTELLDNLVKYQIIITPHLSVQTDLDNFIPNETNHLNTGIYNLGFLATSRGDETYHLIDWWKERLRTECKIDLANGLFVDQIWINFVPLYYKNFLIEKGDGYNVAYWNLHTKTIIHENNKWLVNKSPLYFFHYSGFELKNPQIVSKYQNRIEFSQRQDILPLFEYYASKLTIHNNEYFVKYKCFYIKPNKVKKYRRIRNILQYPFRKVLAIIS
jgi:hypothetical protein